MDSEVRRLRRRSLFPSVEGMEARCLLTTALPDIAMISATTTDSKSVTFDYSIANSDVTQPIHFEVYRSATAQFASGAVRWAAWMSRPATRPLREPTSRRSPCPAVFLPTRAALRAGRGRPLERRRRDFQGEQHG